MVDNVEREHAHNCECDRCVDQRNARRRRDIDRHASEGRPLPPGSVVFEIKRSRPPTYRYNALQPDDIANRLAESRAAEVDKQRAAFESLLKRNSTVVPTASQREPAVGETAQVDEELLQHRSPASESNPPREARRSNPRPAPAASATTAHRSSGAWGKILIVALIAAAIGGAAVYGAMLYLGSDDDQSGFQAVAAVPTPSPTPSAVPTSTPLPAVGVAPTPTSTPVPTETPAPTPTSTPIPKATATPTAQRPTEREVVVNAFAVCDGQYSGRDKEFRLHAADSAISDGRQTVADIRSLVEEHCGGVFPTLAVALIPENRMETPMTRPTTVPTPTAVPIPPTTFHTRAATSTAVPTRTQVPEFAGATGADGRFNQATLEATIYQRINSYRVEQGLQALKSDDRLAQLARAHSQDMAANDYYKHTNLNGEDPSARASKAGYNCHNPLSIGIAENIHLLYGHTSSIRWGNSVTYQWLTQDEVANRFVADWINSPGHRRNILDRRYNLTGIGVAFGTASGIKHGIYVVQNFC